MAVPVAEPARAGPRLGMALGLAAGAGFCLGVLWVMRRRSKEAAGQPRLGEAVPGALLPAGGDGADGAVPSPLLLRQDEQLELLERLDFVVRNVAELRKEVEELRNSLQDLAVEIVDEVRTHLEETQRVARRRKFPFSRERSDSTGSSSIYFTTSSRNPNTDDGESEGGYTTANAESDYDRESERESEDEVSCDTVRTMRRDSLELPPEDDSCETVRRLHRDSLELPPERESCDTVRSLHRDSLELPPEGDSCDTVRSLHRDSLELPPEDESCDTIGDLVELPLEDQSSLSAEISLEEGLGQLLEQADRLHSGDEQDRREGFQLLLNNKLAYAGQREFLWRLARAHCDMWELTEDKDERRSYATGGKEELELALQNWDQSAECHQWFAILCGQVSEQESISKRIQAGYVFKEHIDKAIALKPQDPQLYYLLGRWCYQVAHLGWLEKRTVSALFEAPLTATVQDALQNFLRVEELSPGFSKAGRVYIAKCYRDLGNASQAVLWMDLAAELPGYTKEDAESEKELEEMRSVCKE
ncbi:LOW QUALITY PROTEIN: regulator of microtubule dynamics protein 3 [Molothrus ater]|uniref:LOW QUALITY PROTEIN: regulator of microtubule dynamics protein 3 n=1 Tax=Molothrus ater TaxID=84834 RepID=UPI001749EE58|nr:LOW QUALITY PROTEIN: regulator of microtubule dynamics protein 3 [Molothrus ater]